MGVQIRGPNNEELLECVKLIYMSNPELLSYLFVLKEPDIYNFLFSLIKNPGIFSKENIIIEIDNGNVQGLILVYPASDEKQLGEKMFKKTGNIISELGLIKFLKMVCRGRIFDSLPPNNMDELVISNLAVGVQYRRMGVATRLLKKAEEIALIYGLTKLSLFVDINNPEAKKLYEKIHFHEVEKITLPPKYNKWNISGSYKMVKSIVEN
ncbi:MAG: GNAT family N-acetyltransferase [bacterium]|nr:GNAT family N-acetyltransferase [bacterium]